MKHRKGRSRRGFTVVELVLTTAITLFVFLVGVGAYLMGMSSWYQGESRIQSDIGAQQAVREISMQLRTAMTVTVDGNGQGLNFNEPLTDENGTYLVPLQSDGVARRIELDGSNLVLKVTGLPDQILCANVVTKDPLSAGGNGTYRIFTPGAGSVARSVTIMIVSQQGTFQNNGNVYGRRRETIFLRNVPQLTS